MIYFYRMHKLLLKNIGLLLGVYETAPQKLSGVAMGLVPQLEDAWLACEDGLIADFGNMADFPGITDWKDLEVIDCTGRMVMPCFADSHTHIVYSGSREKEFSDRINGLSYEDIAARGGGILNSVARLRSTTEDDMYHQALVRFEEIMQQGTGAVEIKSGYGLDLESELKMLRVIRRLRDLDKIPVKATLLAAHAVPAEYSGKKDEYVAFLIREMIPEVARQGLADYIDVFCEKNYFDENDTVMLLEAGDKHGLKGRVHAEQLSHSGGIRAGVKCRAVSVDHLEYCSDEDIDLLKTSDTMPTILPGAAFFLGLPFPPVRKMLNAGLPVAMASDYNPGSSPSGNLKLMMSIACIQYRMTPDEAFNACTVNTAYAMGLQDEAGTITRGKKARLIITKPASGLAMLPYAFGSNMIERVVL
jgi:imidazolonepropionase